MLRALFLVQFHRDIDGQGQEILRAVAVAFSQVKQIYLSKGSYEAVVFIEAENEEEVRIVGGKISRMPDIASVNPLRDLEAVPFKRNKGT